MKKGSSRRGAPPRGGSAFPTVPTDDRHPPQGLGLRQARLQEVLREELDMLLRDDVRDPALAGASVSHVELSADCRSARVHVTAPGDRRPPEVVRALERATPFLRASLAGALDMKFVPALRFTAVAAAGGAHDPPGGDDR